MKFQIKHRLTGEILFEAKAASIKIAVESAVEVYADLWNAL